MNTPEKSQIGTSISKFEDSPVFNYLSNLSPIKPVQSAPVTQTFNSLNFSSLPSIFTSPHISLQKESKFLRRHNTPSKSQSEFAYIDASSNKENEIFVNVNHPESGEPRSLRESLNAESNYQAERTSIRSTAIQKSPSGWESLLLDGADLLMFDSPNITKDLNALFKSPPVVNVDSSLASQFQQDNPGFNVSDSAYLIDVGEFQTEEIYTHNNFPNENADDESMISLHGGLHRRSLVFDANLLGASSSNSSMCIKSDQNVASSTIRKQVISKSTASTSSLRVLSGIGLHLNTMVPSEDNGFHVCVASSSSMTSFQSPITAPESLRDDSGSAQRSDDTLLSADVFDPNSPRKKRQKHGSSGDEPCKGCNCKKSKCLKLYCECFAAGVYCIGNCACQDCNNQPSHEETVLATRKQIESRNPLAFAPKVIRTVEPLPDFKDEVMNTPASARHKRGCNCKKSNCQKKYCECYQGGVGCSVNCRCETCKNMFGTKNGGSVPSTSHDDEELEKVEKKLNKKGSRNIMFHKIKEHDHSTFSEPNHLKSQYSTGEEDEIEIFEMLGHTGSFTTSVVKTRSPNSKRISSLNSNFGSASDRRQHSTRKLLLKSIPSFPSLTQP